MIKLIDNSQFSAISDWFGFKIAVPWVNVGIGIKICILSFVIGILVYIVYALLNLRYKVHSRREFSRLTMVYFQVLLSMMVAFWFVSYLSIPLIIWQGLVNQKKWDSEDREFNNIVDFDKNVLFRHYCFGVIGAKQRMAEFERLTPQEQTALVNDWKGVHKKQDTLSPFVWWLVVSILMVVTLTLLDVGYLLVVR
jgi:hypothetical protein